MRELNRIFWPTEVALRKLGIWAFPAPPAGTKLRRKKPRRRPTGCLWVRPMPNRRPMLNPPPMPF